MTLLERVRAAIRTRALVPPGGRVLVAVSGGADSVALLRVLCALAARSELAVAGVVHINHGLRDAAEGDERFCRELASELRVEYRSDLVDVRARAVRLGVSLEVAGRCARYETFERVANELEAAAIATGHTRDDQAETFLLRVIRGAGARGLGGIHPRAGRVVRPLLDVRRAELRGYLASIGQLFRDDESNRDESIPRNRIRHELLPLLERRYSPGIVDVLAREAEIARAENSRLDREAIEIAGSVVLTDRSREVSGGAGDDDRHAAGDAMRHAASTELARPAGTVRRAAGGGVTIDALALASLDVAIGSRVAHLALSVLAPPGTITASHVDRLLAIAADPAARSASFPGQQVVRSWGALLLSRPPAEPFANSFRAPLSIPGEALLPAVGWTITASIEQPELTVEQPGLRGSDPTSGGGRDPNRIGSVEIATVPAIGSGPASSTEVTIPPGSDPDRGGHLARVRACGGLAVRTRQRGDRFRPPGMGGRIKKLQDYLVDRKVPRHERDAVPLVVDAADRIVWVVGHGVAEDFRPGQPSQGVLILTARRLGGPG